MKEAFEKIIERLGKSKDPIKLLTPSWLSREERVIQFKGYEEGVRDAIKIVNQVAEEYGTDINVGSKDCSKCSRRSWYQIGYADAEKKCALPKEAFDRMIARMESQGEKDWDGESWFINVNDAARIIFEIAREYTSTEHNNSSIDT